MYTNKHMTLQIPWKDTLFNSYQEQEINLSLQWFRKPFLTAGNLCA